MRGLNEHGIFLAELIVSLLLVSLVVVSAFSIFDFFKQNRLDREKRLRALYVARSRLEELLSRNFDSLDTMVGCDSISNYIGENDYLEGNVCVYLNTISNWDGDPNVDAKQLEVKVTFI